ncbi:hypothetical protein BCAR13_790053 [Paraburkholderia caribensis]|nr:hypothetical protein BCAR13_790053 [Paraburkholderia caribensis]
MTILLGTSPQEASTRSKNRFAAIGRVSVLVNGGGFGFFERQGMHATSHVFWATTWTWRKTRRLIRMTVT